MWSRDDTRWVDRLVDVRKLMDSTPDAYKSVWSKDCKQWTGINDKVVFMGRTAASVLMNAWGAYWRAAPALASVNAELYLKVLASSKGLTLRVLSHRNMPSGDAMHLGMGRYCFIKQYWCGPEKDILATGDSVCEKEWAKVRAAERAKAGSASTSKTKR